MCVEARWGLVVRQIAGHALDLPPRIGREADVRRLHTGVVQWRGLFIVTILPALLVRLGRARGGRRRWRRIRRTAYVPGADDVDVTIEVPPTDKIEFTVRNLRDLVPSELVELHLHNGILLIGIHVFSVIAILCEAGRRGPTPCPYTHPPAA